MSTILPLDDPTAMDKAVEVLSAGSVVVLPVGGVYAIVADAFRPAATQRIFAARRRSRATPLPVVIRSERQVSGLVSEVPETADRLMAAYWPGELTLVMTAGEGLSWDLGQSLGTVQLRLPSEDFVLRLAGTVGPLACTSANRLEQPRPTTVEDAKAQLGVLVPLYLDGGELDGSVSTIVDVTGPSVVVQRDGAIPAHHIHLVADGELPWGQRPAEADGTDDGAAAGDGVDAAEVDPEEVADAVLPEAAEDAVDEAAEDPAGDPAGDEDRVAGQSPTAEA